ncbi:hypothetical protein [Sciscionella sediminilitoris]|uniref:hypothetical protein n=1 Tax=Sciscionella sediminilitoris TaxID=1445613 RepID=UPI0004DF2770|nr:hypothetical protein [Sciscionella sp. SE31]
MTEEGPLAGKTITYVGGVPGVVLLDGIARWLTTALDELGATVVNVYQLNAQNQFGLGAANQRKRPAFRYPGPAHAGIVRTTSRTAIPGAAKPDTPSVC